jgi:hypothetical protein
MSPPHRVDTLSPPPSSPTNTRLRVALRTLVTLFFLGAVCVCVCVCAGLRETNFLRRERCGRGDSAGRKKKTLRYPADQRRSKSAGRSRAALRTRILTLAAAAAAAGSTESAVGVGAVASGTDVLLRDDRKCANSAREARLGSRARHGGGERAAGGRITQRAERVHNEVAVVKRRGSPRERPAQLKLDAPGRQAHRQARVPLVHGDVGRVQIGKMRHESRRVDSLPALIARFPRACGRAD